MPPDRCFRKVPSGTGFRLEVVSERICKGRKPAATAPAIGKGRVFRSVGSDFRAGFVVGIRAKDDGVGQ